LHTSTTKIVRLSFVTLPTSIKKIAKLNFIQCFDWLQCQILGKFDAEHSLFAYQLVAELSSAISKWQYKWHHNTKIPVINFVTLRTSKTKSVKLNSVTFRTSHKN
jgi:hypothetical protein